VLLHQPFTDAQSLGQFVDLGRSMHSGHLCMWTFLFPGHASNYLHALLHANTVPACASAIPTLLCPDCHGKENWMQ